MARTKQTITNAMIWNLLLQIQRQQTHIERELAALKPEPEPEIPNAETQAAMADGGETHIFTTMEDARKWYATAKPNDSIRFENADDALAWLYDDADDTEA
jgi:hypothetical protein